MVSPIRGPILNPIMRPHNGVSAHDLKVAANLKPAIKEVLMRVRFGAPLSAADSPKRDTKGNWVAPNGNKLVRVQLSDKPPAGSADMQSQFALVDPKTNQFYEATAGGLAGKTFFHGPLALPAGAKFTGKTFSAADLKKIEKTANNPPAKTPTAKELLNAYGAYSFHGLLKFGMKAPADSNIAKRITVQDQRPVDGRLVVALLLKNDPTKVVFQLSGGRAGGVPVYSQPVDFTRLPK